MADLRDILAYILQRYPAKDDLSNARVTKMVYMSDWKHALDHGRQISPIHWYFDNFGPFVWDVKKTAEADPNLFRVRYGTTASGADKVILSCTRQDYQPNLSPSERAAIDHVLRTTGEMGFIDFINLVYSTYPIRVRDRYSFLDLPELAAEYRETGMYAG